MVLIEVAQLGDRIRLWCMDRYDQSRETRVGTYNEYIVYVEAACEMPAVGDDVWLTSDTVYWTPADHRFLDRPLRRIARPPSIP